MSSTADSKRTELRKSDYIADALLVAQASAGNREALAELCNVIAKGVLYRVKYSINSHSDAEDISQEVLIQVCTKIHELRAPEAFRVWLGRIIIGETNRFLKKGIKHRDILNISDYIDTIEEDRESFLPAEFTENDDSRRAVLSSISKLPVRQRQVVMFYYYDGLSVNDIAESMELAQSSVSTHLARARESIKTDLQKEAQHSPGTAAKLHAVPIGILLFDAFSAEAAAFTMTGTGWVQGAILATQGAAASEGAKAAATTAGKTASIGIFILKCAAVCIIGILCCGVLMMDFKPATAPEEEAVEWKEVESAAVGDGKVVFESSGVYRGTNRVNPISASIEFGDDEVAISVSQWWITTRENGDNILFSGYGGDVDLALLELQVKEQYGEYMIRFLLESESGATYRMSSNFYIKELTEDHQQEN